MSRLSDPFSLKSTERWANQKIVQWLNEIFKEKGLGYYAEQELSLPDGSKIPDIFIFDSNKRVACLIELKTPSIDILSDTLLKKTFHEADHNSIKSSYFGTYNVNYLYLFSTQDYLDKIIRKDPPEPLNQAIIETFEGPRTETLESLNDLTYTAHMKRFLEKFVDSFTEIYEGRIKEKKKPVEEYLIDRIHQTVIALSYAYKENVMEHAQKDIRFKQKVAAWFNEQMWDFADTPENYEKLARQAAYLMINKILFYTALQEKHDLSPLEIPKGLRDGDVLQGVLKSYFKKVLEIDYETIFTTDFIDEIAFPSDEASVEGLRDLINEINKFKISELGYEIIGQVFERIIPEHERHVLGQYFTNADIVDLILKFCIRNETDKIFDPGCGAGTFLVRGYKHKKIMNHRLKHEQILPTVWGNDISKFASHLSTINLAKFDLISDENYPRVLHKDFFEFTPSNVEFSKPVKVKGLGGLEREVEHIGEFDAVVGNPPYTRQEEIEELGEVGYKKQLIEKSIWHNGEKLANLTKRAGIHAYFFVHGYKFLKEGGRFGFIVSNSWLDVDWGSGLQEFFLKHYKITAIIDSEVERWFADADVNTCIVILEKCSKEEERSENLVRFVSLKKKLPELIPRPEKKFEEEVARLDAVDDLVKTIISKTSNYENYDLRIRVKTQKELWGEGYDAKEKKYVGAKWGKYIRAPDIFFTVMERGKGKFVPLKEVADIRRGFTTGANEFFYLTEEDIKTWGVEKEFWMHKEARKWIPNYVIKSPKEVKGILVKPEDLKFRVLMIHKDKKDLKGTNVLKYIEWGERQGFHKNPTCASRKLWYGLEETSKPSMIWIKGIWTRHFIPMTGTIAYCDQQLYALTIKPKLNVKSLCAVLNSTYFFMIQELMGRVNFGEGILWIATYEAINTPVINILEHSKAQIKKIDTAFGLLSKRTVSSVFEEIGAYNENEVSLEKVKSDRRELDKIVMAEILGLTEKEQLEVYKAVVKLVRQRIEKAQSIERKSASKKPKEEDMVKPIIEAIGPSILKDFFAKNAPEGEIMELPEFKEVPEISKGLIHGWQLRSKKVVLNCDSKEQAKYLRIASLLGLKRVPVPKAITPKLLTEFGELTNKISEILEERLKLIIDRKKREKTRFEVLRRLGKDFG